MSLFSKYVPFKLELERYIEHCKTVFDEIGDRASSRLVEGLIKDIGNQRYNITIVGSLKRGKSTLLNALMERRDDSMSPISSVVCTSAIIKYIDKSLSGSAEKKEEAVVYLNNPDETPATIPLRRLEDYVTEAKNPGNRKNVKAIDVFGDFPEWSKAVTIIDSPGQGSVFSYHDILLTDFLPYTDAIIFLVSADIPLDGSDIALLKELSAEQKKKIFFVLTKIDNIENRDDLQDVVDFVTSKIAEVGIPCDKLYQVAAKPVYDALCKGVTGHELENVKFENGISELETDLESFIVKESDQTKVIRSRIETMLKCTADACNNYVDAFTKIMSTQTYDLAKLQAEEGELTKANEELSENTKKALKKFEREWRKTLSTFERKFSLKANAVEDKIIDGLGRGGLISAAFQSFKLKQQVEKALSIEIQPIVNDLEETLSRVVSNLAKEFDDELLLYVRRNNSTDIATTGAAVLAVALKMGTDASGVIATCSTVSTAIAEYGGVIVAQGKTAFWSNWFGTTAASTVATAGSTATTAVLTAITTAGVSIIVMIIVQKILHIGLVKFQETRIPGMTESVMSEMEEKLFKNLEVYKDAVVNDYKQRIDDVVTGNQERLETVKKLIASDDSEERARIAERVEKVKCLLAEGVQVNKQIPLLAKGE